MTEKDVALQLVGWIMLICMTGALALAVLILWIDVTDAIITRNFKKGRYKDEIKRIRL